MIYKIIFLSFLLFLNLNAAMEDDIVYVEDKTSNQISLKDEFLNPNTKFYTISICTLDLSKYDPIEYFKTFNMTNAVAYKFGENKEFARIISGVYKTGTEATAAIKDLDPRLIRNKPYSANLKRHQELFSEYNENIKKATTSKKKIEEIKPIKKSSKSIFINNSEEAKKLKEEFLNDDSQFYSIALGSISLKQSSIEKFFQTYGVGDEALAHLYGKNKDKARIIYGLYKTRAEAINAIKEFNDNLKSNKPYSMKMEKFQSFYKKNISKDENNPIVELKINDKKEEKKVNVKLSDEIKIVDIPKKEIPKKEKIAKVKQEKPKVEEKKSKAIKKKIKKQTTKTKILENNNKFLKESKLVDVFYVEEDGEFNILSEVFLNDGSSFFTIDFGEINLKESTIEQSFINNKIKNEALAYKYGDNKEYARLIYGAFETKDDAKKTIEELNVTSLKNLKVSNIKNHQKLYKVYHKNKMIYNSKKNDTQVKTKKYEFDYSSVYAKLENSKSKIKDEFFNRDSKKYTITLITFLKDDMRVDKFFEYNNLYEEVLAFPIGSQNSYYRVIKGVYDSFDEANEAINSLSEDLRENQPYVSRISSQQKKLEKYGRVLENEMKQIQMIEFK